MKKFKTYINNITPVKEETFEELQMCFNPIQLLKNEFFVREGAYAGQIGFLKEGIVRAFFLTPDGKEYSKQFFVGPLIIGA